MSFFASISVTSYNRKKLTEYCIKSIIENTPRENFELVVVDNQSTDGTIDVLNKMYSDKIIDKLIVNQQDSLLGTAINLAWKEACSRSKWLITFSNDHFVMDKWFTNLSAVIKDEKPQYVLCHLLMPGYSPEGRQVIKTPSGGRYLRKRDSDRFIFGGGLALRRDVYGKYKIRFTELARKNSPFSMVCKQLSQINLKGIELAKPCSLQLDCNWNNPAYKEYYERIYSKRSKMGVLRDYQEHGYTPYVEEYYTGTNYLNEKKIIKKSLKEE